MGEYVARMRDMRNVHKVLVGIPEQKGLLPRPRYRWEGNIRMSFREAGWGDMDWMILAQDRDQWQALVNTVMSLCVT